MYSTAHKNKKTKLMFDGFIEHGHFTRSVSSRPATDVFAPVDSSDVRLDFANVTPEKIKSYATKIISMSRRVYRVISALGNSETQLTFANVIQPEINLEIAVANMRCLCTKVCSLYPDKSVRDACTEASQQLSAFDTEIEMRKDLYEVFYRYYIKYYPSEKQSLTDQESLRVETCYATYYGNGMHLSDNKLKEVSEIKEKISRLEADYMSNLNEDSTCLYFTRDQLDGMPSTWFDSKEKNAKSEYMVTMKSPDISTALNFVHNRGVRKKLSIAYNSRASQTNEAIFNKVIILRHQLAKTLGHASYAEMEAKSSMAATKKNIMSFLSDLDEKITPLFENEIEALRKLARDCTNDEDFKLESWDVKYYAGIYKNHVYDLEPGSLEKYFPLDAVTQGLFKIYERMLGLRFFEKNTDNKWHHSVKYFEAYDYDYQSGELGDMVGAFYLDLHPRDGKYAHAMVFPFIYGYQSKNRELIKEHRLPLCTIVCNFSESGGLGFKEVETLFHEFGHAMHILCSGRVELQTLNGFSVSSDFIETPSQMLENWILVPEALKLMSRHIETHQPIDDETIQKLIKSEKVFKAYATKENLMLSLFDMNIHMPPYSSQAQLDANAVFRDHYQSHIGIDYPEGYHYLSSFEHLMEGYAAGYFVYTWALANATDMFYEKFKEDPMSLDAGRHYRETILNVGATKPSMDMLCEFLGRKPSNRHYLQSLGVGPAQHEHNLRKRIVKW